MIQVEKELLLELRFHLLRLIQEVENHNDSFGHVTQAKVIAAAEAAMSKMDAALEQPSLALPRSEDLSRDQDWEF